MNARTSVLAIALVCTGTIAACEPEQPAERTEPVDTLSPVPTTAPPPTGPAAEAVRVELIDRQGQGIGTATLTEADDGVRIAVEASGLPPGPKGFHIHETGRCEPPDFESAGEHFSPFGRQHGFQNPQGPHAGDLPNLPVRPDGTADTTVVAREVMLRPGQQNSLLAGDGTALVIHEQPDDYRTDPAGQAGDRLACGEITRP